MLQEFGNGDFTLNALSLYTTPEQKSKNSTMIGHFEFVFLKGKTRSRNHLIVASHRFREPPNLRSAFSNSGLKSAFEKLRFRDGLGRTVGIVYMPSIIVLPKNRTQ